MCDTFQKGKLYLRVINGQPGMLFYPDKAVPLNYVEFDCHAIAVNDYGIWRPHFHSYTFSTRNNGYSPSDQHITYRLVSDADIVSVVSRWDILSPLQAWIESFPDRAGGLLVEEVVRISRICRKFL